MFTLILCELPVSCRGSDSKASIDTQGLPVLLVVLDFDMQDILWEQLQHAHEWRLNLGMSCPKKAK